MTRITLIAFVGLAAVVVSADISLAQSRPPNVITRLEQQISP